MSPDYPKLRNCGGKRGDRVTGERTPQAATDNLATQWTK